MPRNSSTDGRQAGRRQLPGLPTGPSRAERIFACLAGGAIGDGLGYEIEFDWLPDIHRRFGAGGIAEPVFHDGRLIVSDDTQMTLFTAEGLVAAFKVSDRPDDDSIIAAIGSAYRDWLRTQSAPFEEARDGLIGHRSLWARRAPGQTCTSALIDGGDGTPEKPINESKGCGGVMRAAPIGLVEGIDSDRAFRLGARAAALTHGHPSGYLSAAAMAGIIADLMAGTDLGGAVAAARGRLAEWPSHQETLAAIDNAVALSEAPAGDHLAAIAKLGRGWVGEEALAIGLYAALVASSFEEAVRIGANHDGDSDSTASIAGQIWGAGRGPQGMPQEWIARLDVIDPLRQMAAGLGNLKTPNGNAAA